MMSYKKFDWNKHFKSVSRREQFGAEGLTGEATPPWWDKFGTLGDTLGGFTVFVSALAGLFFITRNCKIQRRK